MAVPKARLPKSDSSGSQVFLEVKLCSLLPGICLFFLPVSLSLLIVLFELCGILFGLLDCLVARPFSALVLVNCHYHLLSNEDWLARVHGVLEMTGRLPNRVDDNFGHLPANRNPSSIALLCCVLDPLVLWGQPWQVLRAAAVVLHEPIDLVLLRLIRVLESRIVEVGWVQPGWSRRRFRRPLSSGPAPEQPQGSICILQALAQLASFESGEATVCVDHGALIICSSCRLFIEAECGFSRLILVGTHAPPGCGVRSLLWAKSCFSLADSFQVSFHQLTLLQVQAVVGIQCLLEVRFCLPKGAQPEVGRAHANFNADSDLLVQWIRWRRHLPGRSPASQIQDADGTVAVL
mmetsp:Transcript_51671/g.83835  ORF Transcript_51671/g.83835 Transcript_51671/m.83835 type:complete len:349 (-) Transcript_51671:1176-2222(-)